MVEAKNGNEALGVCERADQKIDLLLTDMVLPRMNGRDLAERVMASRPEARVLYISGYTDDAVLKQGILTAESVFLQTPFTTEALLRKVRDVLGTAAARG